VFAQALEGQLNRNKRKRSRTFLLEDRCMCDVKGISKCPQTLLQDTLEFVYTL
jgi:hypothetical protein